MSEALEPALQGALEWENRLIDDNLRRIFLLIYRIVGNVADAQDLTQETFIKALQRREQLRDAERAAHWLSRIATNTAIDFLRRHGRLNQCELEEAGGPLISPLESPEEMVLEAERRQWL
ncbi:MAG: RNA polymerase sigma factor, partial [Bryobacteraceae bacterium]